MKPINIFLFLALLSAAAALPVLDNTTPPPTAAQAEEPALINAASIPKIVIPPLPSAPHKPEQPPPVKPPPTAEPIPPPPPPIADAAYADDVELDDLVADGADDSDGPDGDHDDDDDGDSEKSTKAKQQQLKVFVQNTTTTNAKHPKLEAKKMTCSIENDHLVCASVDLSKVEFEPAECTTATDNNNVTICRRSLAAYSSSDGESH